MVFVLLFFATIIDFFHGAAAFNDFPSLITANATMAVVIDKSLFQDDAKYDDIMKNISEILYSTVKQNMNFGSITTHIYTDSRTYIKRDYTLLLSLVSCAETWRLYKNSQKEDIAHLAMTDSDCPRLPQNEGISIPLIDPGQELPQLILDMRMSSILKSDKINVIHDDTFGRDMVSRVFRALSKELPDNRLTLSSVTIFTLSHESTDWGRRRQVMKTLNGFRVGQLGSNFLIIVSIDMVGVVMEVARSLKMVHTGSHWLYVISDTTKSNINVSSFAETLIEGENAAFVYNTTINMNSCKAGLKCHLQEIVKAVAITLEQILQKEVQLYEEVTDEEFEVMRLTKAELRREIIRNTNNELSFARSLSDDSCGQCLSWKICTGLTWGSSFVSDNQTTMGELIDIGSWTPGPGPNMADVIFPHVEHGFRGRTLPLVSYHNPPWQVIGTAENGDVVYSGLIFDVVNFLSEKLNFTYTVIIPEGMEESKSLNRSRQGIPQKVLELVSSKKVLMAACAYTVTEVQKSIVNFTIPISIQTYSILASRPKQLSRALLFMSPYTKEAWACLAATIIIMGPILYLVHKFSPRRTNALVPAGLNSPWECVWYVYGALLQQGGMHLPQADSARLIVGTWWLVVIVVVSTYSGSLVAFLTFPRMDQSISTVDDLLARKHELTWGIPAGSYLEESILAIDEPKYRELLSGSDKRLTTENEDNIRRVKEGKHVFIDWRSSLIFLMKQEFQTTGSCDFSLSPEEFMEEPIGMIVARDSPYLSIFNEQIKRMHQIGLIQKWTSQKMPTRDRCWEGLGKSQEARNHKVNMGDMQGSFFVLAIGFFIAVFMLSLEYCWHRRKMTKERKLIRPFVT